MIAACCGRSRAEALREHVATGCTARAYSRQEVEDLAALGVIIDEDDQHDDCDLRLCAPLVDECRCVCADCSLARLRARIDDASDERRALAIDRALDELLDRDRGLER